MNGLEKPVCLGMWTCCFLALILSVPPTTLAARCSASYTFTLIADSDVDLHGNLALELDPFCCGLYDAHGIWPAVDVSGVVVFRSELDTGGVGLFTGDGLNLKTLVLTKDADQDSEFLTLPTPATIATVNINWHGVAFYGTKEGDTFPEEGIFRARFGEPTDMIALTDASDQNSPYRFLSQEPDIRTNGSVLFAADLKPGSPRAMVSSSVQNSQILFTSDSMSIFFENPVANDSDVAFSGNPRTSFYTGVYRYRQGVREHWEPSDSFGPLKPAISDHSISPGGFIVAMVDDWINRKRILVRFGESSVGRTILADEDEDPLELFTIASVDGNGCAAFIAYNPNAYLRGIYVADEDGINPILQIVDPLFDGTVLDLQMYKHAVNSRGQIAFWAQIDVDRRVIVRADPVSFPCLSDLDENGATDGSDLARFAGSYGASFDDTNYDLSADFDDSRGIDQNDLIGFVSQFGGVGCVFQ